MTVMVTGASGLVGRTVVPLLLAHDEVRACVRNPHSAQPLRELGAKVAVGRMDDADALAEILRRVYTLIHLVGGPNQANDDEAFAANHGSVLTAVAAAREAGVRRFILVSAPGAAVDAEHPYLRAKGLAEEAVVNSGLEYVIVRAAHVYGLGGLWFTSIVEGSIASPPFVVGDGAQVLAPVFVHDLAAVLAAADDRGGDLRGTWAVEGPDVISAADLVALLAAGDATPTPLTPDEAAVRLTEALGTPVWPAATTLFARSSRADGPDAAAAFDVERTTLADGLQITMERATPSGR